MSQCCSTLCDAAAEKFNAARAEEDLAQWHANGPGKTTRGLLEGIAVAGHRPSTLLDIGSGIGTLSFELLNTGVSHATCVDMSPAFVACGEKEAARRGVTERITWRMADFVTAAAEVPSAELVALDRVVCCYPAFQPLLQHAADHAKILLALSYPKDRWHARLSLGAENLLRKVRGSAFRAFVHPANAMDALLVAAGFERISRESTIMWHMDIWRRVAARV